MQKQFAEVPSVSGSPVVIALDAVQKFHVDRSTENVDRQAGLTPRSGNDEKEMIRMNQRAEIDGRQRLSSSAIDRQLGQDSELPTEIENAVAETPRFPHGTHP